MFSIRPYSVTEHDDDPPIRFTGVRLVVGRKVRRYFDIGIGYAKSIKKVST